MRIVRSGSGWVSGLLAVALVTIAGHVEAQTTKMPSTLRYGSGYLDVPSASVLPHLTVTGTFSGFFVNLDQALVTDANGNITALVPQDVSQSFFDGSVALGLFDRVEIGTSLQSFNDSDAGGNIWGAFGRIAILRPQDQGIGLAAGVRYVTAPEFNDGVEYAPNRLGFPDQRFRADLPDGPGDGIDTELTIYGVASAMVRGIDADWLPEHDLTLSAGYGNGMFTDGEKIQFYRFADSEGWFFGGVTHVKLSDSALLNIMGEYNGFDVNFGAQLDLGGFRVGGHVLGANYWKDVGIYRSSKYGFLASVCLDLSGGSIRCRPSLMNRPMADTVQLPPPPPDTVTVTREVAPPLPTGTPTNICLATGESTTVYVTAQGDTLVGPNRVSVRTLRPGVVFAGTYAEGRGWFENDEAVTFEEREYQKSGGEVRLDCANIMRIGEFQGVPLFAMRNAERPFETVYAPVRPGVWQAYQTGLRRTRGLF